MDIQMQIQELLTSIFSGIPTPISDISREVIINRGAHYASQLLEKYKTNKSMQQNIEKPYIFLNHRRFFKEKFLFHALQEPNRILFITIMSKHTLKQIKSLPKKQLKVKQLRVLTMKPRIGVDQISHSIALHLDEPPARSVSSQINNAWKEWGKIENKNPKKILLRGYDSIPTLQGHIVKDQYALIELLTFHTPPDDRAAILATKKDTPALFNLFSSKFEKLWLESSK